MQVTKKQIAETLKEVMASKNVKLTSAESNLCVAIVFQAVKNAVANVGEARIDGFGSFKRKDVPERTFRNPRTGEPVVAPAHQTVLFRAAKQLLDAVNGND